MTTYADFEAQVRRSLEEPNENVWKSASLLYWTNETAREMASRVRQNEEETYTTTVAGTSDYALPTDTQEITAVFFDGKLLYREQPESRYTIPDSSGTPQAYQRMDEVMRLRPTPDSAATLLILRRVYPTDMTSGEDEMPFRSERNSVIEYGVLARAFEQTQDWQTADAFKQRFEAALAIFDADASIAEEAGTSAWPIETY